MAHHTLKSSYDLLTDRLNNFPQGAPPSETLFRILSVLFTEEEAKLVALLPIRPFTAKAAARNWKTGLNDARKILDQLASRAILLDVDHDGETWYVLPPPMAGFFEFSLMRLRGDINQKVLSELFYQYLNVEEDFIKALFTEGDTQLGRTFVHEPVLTNENALYVLDYERASQVIATSTAMGVGICYCRHKMEHLGKNCDAPMDICMTFNNTAVSLIKHDYARSVSKEEGAELLQKAQDHNLVQFGENVRNDVSFICNCCGCCCEAMIAQRKFGQLHPVHTTNFLPVIDSALCNGCGKCVEICPVEAMSLVSAKDPAHPKKKTAKLDEDQCLGCGLCLKACNRESIKLEPRAERVLTPVTTAHRTVVMAIERGKLQNLIFDNHALKSHRAMAAILGVIFKLPPLRQALASRQLKSRYLDNLFQKYHH